MASVQFPKLRQTSGWIIGYWLNCRMKCESYWHELRCPPRVLHKNSFPWNQNINVAYWFGTTPRTLVLCDVYPDMCIHVFRIVTNSNNLKDTNDNSGSNSQKPIYLTWLEMCRTSVVNIRMWLPSRLSHARIARLDMQELTQKTTIAQVGFVKAVKHVISIIEKQKLQKKLEIGCSETCIYICVCVCLNIYVYMYNMHLTR